MTLTDAYVIEERAMTNVEPRPPPAPTYTLPPQSTVQLAHATSDAVISGLAKSPYLLGVVVIVLVGVGAAIYFLQILITGQAKHLDQLLTLERSQQTELITLHKAEFDALLEMANRLSMAAVASAPPVAPIGPNTLPSPPKPAR